MKLKTISAILALSFAISGCSGFKNPFDKNDNTVLPGQREEVLPPDQQVNNTKVPRTGTNNKAVLGTPDQNCEPASPDYPDCLTPTDPAQAETPAIDEESGITQ